MVNYTEIGRETGVLNVVNLTVSNFCKHYSKSSARDITQFCSTFLELVGMVR